MAAGDLITQEQQAEIWRSDTDRLLIGKGTNYGIMSQKGLSLPPIRANDRLRAGRHGDTAGIDKYAPREVEVELIVKGAAGTEQATRLAALGKVLRALRQGDSEPFFIWRGPGLSSRRITGRPRSGDWEYDYHSARGRWCAAGFRFVAFDPLFYSLVEASTVGTITAGLTNIAVAVTNSGDTETEGVFEILGPAVNPRISNAQDANRQFKIDITLTGGQTLIVDQPRRLITLAGVSQYGKLRTDSQWFELVPGVNNLNFSRTGTTGVSTLTVKHRQAYSTIGAP